MILYGWGVVPSSDWSNECNQMSNHRQLQCLCNRLFKRTSEKHESSALLVIVRGILQWLEDYPRKGPVTRKIFLCYDVMMWKVVITYTRSHLGILLKHPCPWVLWHWYSGGQLAHCQPRGCWAVWCSTFNWQIEDRCQTIHFKMGLDFVPHWQITREVTMYTCMKAGASNGFPTWVNVIW